MQIEAVLNNKFSYNALQTPRSNVQSIRVICDMLSPLVAQKYAQKVLIIFIEPFRISSIFEYRLIQHRKIFFVIVVQFNDSCYRIFKAVIIRYINKSIFIKYISYIWIAVVNWNRIRTKGINQFFGIKSTVCGRFKSK